MAVSGGKILKGKDEVWSRGFERDFSGRSNIIERESMERRIKGLENLLNESGKRRGTIGNAHGFPTKPSGA